jgi:hypothetical protein
VTSQVIRGPWRIAHQLGVSECSVSRYAAEGGDAPTRGEAQAVTKRQGFQKLGDVVAGVVAKLDPIR